MMNRLPTNAKWFEPLGRCVCGKPATGALMTNRNDRLGNYCAACAQKAVAQSASLETEWAAARAKLVRP